MKILYFAELVDLLGLASEELNEDLPQNVRELVAQLKQRGGTWEDVFGKRSVRITVNKQFADLDTPLQAGDEVAFISAWI